MALINPIHGDMSGSVGDNVFSHNRGGTYVRRKTIPVNPTTAKQTNVRASLGTISASWRTLSDADQAAWAAWSALNPTINRLGLPQVLSGIGAFIQCNSRLLQAGFTVNTTPPVTGAPSQFLGLAVTPTTPATLSAAFTDTLAADEAMLLWMTLPGSTGRNDNANQARLVGFSALADTTPIAFTTPYTFASGNAFNVYIQKINGNGLVSALQKVRVEVP
jgi:hypothetical protein